MPEVIEDYLGKDFRILKNKSGDPIFVNNNNTRRIRFDAQNSHGDIPHGHVEHYDQNIGKWLDYTEKHRVYLKNALNYLHKPKPGNG